MEKFPPSAAAPPRGSAPDLREPASGRVPGRSRRRSRWLCAAVAALLALGGEGAARAGTRTFPANSIIIPMDFCYQTTNSTTGISGTPAYCIHPTNALNTGEGLILAYGVLYRLLQRGITVYQVINPAKVNMDDVDLTVSAAAGTPVTYYNRTTQVQTEFFSPDKTINYRGAPFLIDGGDYTRVIALIQSDPKFAPIYNYVVLHVAKQSFQAPVALAMEGTPPRIALNNVGSAATNVLLAYLTDAGLNTATAGGVYPTTQGEIFDEFDNDSDFTSGGLITGGYRLFWSPHWTGSAALNQDVTAWGQFADKGFLTFAECASIEEIETSYSNGTITVKAAGATTGHFQASKGLYINGISNWGSTPATQLWKYADVTSPYVQMGDFHLINGGGHVQNWKVNALLGSTYKATVKRLVSSFSATVPASSDWDVMTVVNKDDDPKKGPIFYLGGHDYSKSAAGERLVLNMLLFGGVPYTVSQLARSSPVIDADGTTYQGTYMAVSIAQNQYPPVEGHFRQYPANALNGANLTQFDQVLTSWDAANLMPPAAQRNVFTIVTLAGVPTKVALLAANASILAAPMGLTVTAATTAINGILAGGLGGIDHSTPAIVGPSTLAGSATRAKVAYFGGLDGMVHAIGISGTGVSTPGRELWAFIPPSQLGKIAQYQAGVDGSPQVADAFVDPANTGTRSWRTLLASTNGAFGGTVDMLDVTDPINPTYLWTASSNVGSGAYVMGPAAGAAFGMLLAGTSATSALIVATSNSGTAGNGFNLYALNAGTGAAIWQWDHLYGRRIPSTTTTVPNDVPGVPTIANASGDGGLDDRVFFGDLDGKIWAIDASTGAAPTSPIFDAGADGYPFNAGVALYRDRTTQHLAVIGATGGKDWLPNTFTEYVVAVDTTNAHMLFQTSLTIGERVYALPTVDGNDVYLITSFGAMSGNLLTSFKDAGNLRRFNLSTGASTFTSTVSKGASEVALDAQGNLVGTSAGGITQNGNAGRDAVGVALTTQTRPFTIRAWLDMM